MDASLFISRRLRIKGKIAMISIAISFLVMIIAVSVSSGFRHEIRAGISSVSGDIQLLPLNMNLMDEAAPVESDASYLPYVKEIETVEKVIPVIYRAGIVRYNEEIHGVLIKGMPVEELPFDKPDSVSLAVSIPRRLSELTGIKEGDRMLTYFVGEKVRARQFNVVSVYDSMLETDDKLVVYARADYPHDSWWTQVTLNFSDGSNIDWQLVKSEKAQQITFEPKIIRFITMNNLVKADDPSPFPALTQIEVYGV